MKSSICNPWMLRMGLLVLILFSGCASFSSTLLHRDSNNLCWQRKKHLKGMPVTLEVPTHLKVDVIEKKYLILKRDAKTGENTVQVLPCPTPIREVRKEFIKTKQIFVVDLKRPAAGTLNANIDLDPSKQYFNEIKTELSDTTIDAVSELIASVAPSGLIGAPTSSGEAFNDNLKELESVVATQIFEINAPDFEMTLRNYMEQHLNCCHDCNSGNVEIEVETYFDSGSNSSDFAPDAID